MRNSLTAAAPARERPSLADVCGKPVKADLAPHIPAPRMREVAASSVESTGTQKGAATDIGIDRSRLSHKLKDGSLNLAQMEALGPAFCAEFGRQLLEEYGPLATPQMRVRQALRVMRRLIDEIEQYLEYVA